MPYDTESIGDRSPGDACPLPTLVRPSNGLTRTFGGLSLLGRVTVVAFGDHHRTSPSKNRHRVPTHHSVQCSRMAVRPERKYGKGCGFTAACDRGVTARWRPAPDRPLTSPCLNTARPPGLPGRVVCVRCVSGRGRAAVTATEHIRRGPERVRSVLTSGSLPGQIRSDGGVNTDPPDGPAVRRSDGGSLPVRYQGFGAGVSVRGSTRWSGAEPATSEIPETGSRPEASIGPSSGAGRRGTRRHA